MQIASLYYSSLQILKINSFIAVNENELAIHTKQNLAESNRWFFIFRVQGHTKASRTGRSKSVYVIMQRYHEGGTYADMLWMN